MFTARKTLPAIALSLGLGLFATHALADCEDGQEDAVGKAVASAASGKISAVVAGSGKQMINLETCDAAGGGVTTEFKYNLIGADGLYWAEGKAKLVGGSVKEMTFTKLSPNLASASAAKGVKLASN
ncbi:hypothetical protein [Asticcacaulis solisilvae]|uniref:hypothetical protein n=1 Tax=Asticcacaulis solisilvae TaxID=1217274 RepID=UPI003FD838C9